MTDLSSSIYFFTKSVYDNAGIDKNSASLKLLYKAVLINIRFKKLIGTQITFTTSQILEIVKNITYPQDNFYGIVILGDNMAFPIPCSDISGNINDKLIRCCIDMDGEITGSVKVVVDDYETKQYLDRKIREELVPITLINSEDALTELVEIEKELKKLR